MRPPARHRQTGEDMFEWWTPLHDAAFVFVIGNIGTWLLVKYGRWTER